MMKVRNVYTREQNWLICNLNMHDVENVPSWTWNFKDCHNDIMFGLIFNVIIYM